MLNFTHTVRRLKLDSQRPPVVIFCPAAQQHFAYWTCPSCWLFHFLQGNRRANSHRNGFAHTRRTDGVTGQTRKNNALCRACIKTAKPSERILTPLLFLYGRHRGLPTASTRLLCSHNWVRSCWQWTRILGYLVHAPETWVSNNNSHQRIRIE